LKTVNFNVSPDPKDRRFSNHDIKVPLFQSASNNLTEGNTTNAHVVVSSNSSNLLRTDSLKEKISCAVILTESNSTSNKNKIPIGNSNNLGINSSISLQNASTTIVPSNNATKLESEEISLEENEPYEQDSFADMFFIAGLPKKNAKVITDSRYFTAPCKHKDCSILHSYRADVLYRYPLSNYKGLNLCSSVFLL
jgi:hypothetical protein